MPAQVQPRIVLASASPRRAELLRQIGVRFEQLPVDLDESVLPNETPEDYVKRLAMAKANAASLLLKGDDRALVIGSDTSVIHGGRVFGKPSDKAEFVTMLETLSNRRHEVLTAVALVGNGIEAQLDLVTTRVTFRAIEPAEAEAYWETGEPQDKAGGYAIQGRGAVFVRQIEGSYSAVMGLPVFETAALLGKAGVDLWQAVKE